MAARAIRGLGITIGAALAAVYLLLMWESPPDIDWPHARLRSVVGLYLLFPLLLLAGPIWLFGWIAAFVAPMQSARKKCKTFAKSTGRLTYDCGIRPVHISTRPDPRTNTRRCAHDHSALAGQQRTHSQALHRR
jgi:hypothetical protein